MFVRLSDRHVELLDRQFHQDEVLEFELNRARHQVSAHIFEIEAPYVAWDLVRRDVFDLCYTQTGAVRKRQSQSYGTLLRRVVQAMNAVDRHPALRGVALPGHGPAAMYPAWRRDIGDQFGRIWSALPIIGNEFALLAPQRHEVGGVAVTLWAPDAEGLGRDWYLADEAVHLRLFRGVSARPW
mgnify:CR=1 FL=1